MNIFGIDFISDGSRIQALAVGSWFFGVVLAGYTSLIFCVCLLFTRFWWLTLLYFCWLYLDRDTCERGGRLSKWVQNSAWFHHARNYFPARCFMVPGLKLDPKKNYLFICFPHGVLPAGPYFSLTLESGDFYQHFPDFQVRQTALKQLYYLPFSRDLGLAMGGISCSARSLRYVLSKPEGGQIVLLFPGGAEEATYAKPGQYKFVLKHRKGFAKVALTSGTPLVPVVTFGETNCFDQIQNPVICRFQKIVKKYCGFTPVLYLGRGLFQNNFGCIPKKTPLMTIVGKPIEVTKTENPTKEEIDDLHQKFVIQIMNLFEKYKYKYLKNPENTFLELV